MGQSGVYPLKCKYSPFLSSNKEPSVSCSGTANTWVRSRMPTTGLAFAATTVPQGHESICMRSPSDQQSTARLSSRTSLLQSRAQSPGKGSTSAQNIVEQHQKPRNGMKARGTRSKRESPLYVLSSAMSRQRGSTTATYRQDQHHRTTSNGRVAEMFSRCQCSTQETQERCNRDFEHVHVQFVAYADQLNRNKKCTKRRRCERVDEGSRK